MNYFRSITFLLTLLSCAPLAQCMEAPLPNPNISQEALRELCPICQERIEEYHEYMCSHNCQHKFHTACITPWIAENKTTCPVCKKELYKQPLWFSEDGVVDLDTYNLLLSKIVAASPEFNFWMAKYKKELKISPMKIPYMENYRSNVIFEKNRVLYSTNNGSIKIWNMEAGQFDKSIYTDNDSNQIPAIAYNSKTDCLVSGDLVGALKMWRLSEPNCTGRLLAQLGAVYSVAFDTEKNNILYCVTHPGLITIWDLASGLLLDTIDIALGNEGISCIKFADKKYFIGLANGEIKCVDLLSKNYFVLKPKKSCNNQSILCLDYDYSCQQLRSIDAEGIMKRWDIGTHQCIDFLLLEDGDKIDQAIIDKTGCRIFTYLRNNGTVKIYDINGILQDCFCGLTKALIYHHFPDFPAYMFFDECNNRFGVGQFGKIKLYDLGCLEEKQKILTHIYTDLLFKSAYQCFVKKQKGEDAPLDLTQDQDLETAFINLPAEMQKVIRDTITVISEPRVVQVPAAAATVEPALAPARSAVSSVELVPAPVAPAPAVAKQENSKESWSEWILGKSSK